MGTDGVVNVPAAASGSEFGGLKFGSLRFGAFGLEGSTLFLTLACGAWAMPALAALLKTAWQTEAGTLGPLTLVCGVATLWHEARRKRRGEGPGNLMVAAIGVGMAAMLYALAMAIALTPLACAAAWAGLASTFYGFRGLRGLRRNWFPWAYLLLAIPLPYSLSASVSAVLRDWIARLAVELCHAIGMLAAFDGNAVYIDQYELSVDSACAGLSSTASLVAVGLVYARWMHRARPVHLAALAIAALPVAFATNLVRVVALIVAVHFWGARILATPLHPLTGIFSFGVAMVLIMATDGLLLAAQRVVRRP